MLASWKKSYDQPRCILKSRDITLPTRVCPVKATVFPVVMYGCESWTIKKAEHQSTDAFELWSWRRLLRVPWTARKCNHWILKEISPEYSLEGLMLKLQYFGHLMRRADSLAKTLMLGKTEGKGRRRQQRMRGLDGITDSMDTGLVMDREAWHVATMGLQRVGHNWATELDRIDTKLYLLLPCSPPSPPSSQKVLSQTGLGLLVTPSLTPDSMDLSHLLMLWSHILPSFHQEARQAAAWFYPEAHGLSQTQDSCCNKQHRDACSFLHPHLKK